MNTHTTSAIDVVGVCPVCYGAAKLPSSIEIITLVCTSSIPMGTPIQSFNSDKRLF